MTQRCNEQLAGLWAAGWPSGLRNHSVNRQASAVHPDKTSLTNILNVHTHAIKLATFAGRVCVSGTNAKLERPKRAYACAITFYLHRDPELQQNTVMDNKSDIKILRIHIIINIRVLFKRMMVFIFCCLENKTGKIISLAEALRFRSKNTI